MYERYPIYDNEIHAQMSIRSRHMLAQVKAYMDVIGDFHLLYIEI